MEKKRWIFAGVLCLALCMTALASEGQSVVQAKEQPAKQRREQVRTQRLSTYGNMVYQDDGKRAEIYAADFSLLHDKLAMVSEDIFDPSGYAHIYQQEEESTHVLLFDVADETSIDCGYQVEEAVPNELPETASEETTMPEADELPEIIDGETTMPEADELPETTGGDTTTPGADELPEITGGEMTTPEADELPETTGGDTTTPESDETPEITVSGNDIEYENDVREY